VSTESADFWKSLPTASGVSLICTDSNGLGALAKPAGTLSHPNSPKDSGRSLLTTAYDKRSECFVWNPAGGPERRLWLLNRLDSATSGVVLVASDAALALEIKGVFARHGVIKIYNALVFGRPHATEERWNDRLGVERRGSVVRTGSGNIPAQSEMRVVREGGGSPGTTLLELRPLTGRTHQLRVQCAKRHLPIVGDATYGDFRKNREFAKTMETKRLFLHSVETRLQYRRGGRVYAFRAVAPLPEEFMRAIVAQA